MEQKRIIFTVTNDLSFDQRMHRICTTLAESGLEVLLVGRKRKNSIPLETKLFKQKRLKCFFEKGKLFYVEYNLRLLLFLLFLKCDAISSVDLDTLPACTFACKIRSKKLVFDAHEYFTEVPEVTNRKITKFIWSVVARTHTPQANLAYTVSKSLADIFSAKYKIPFSVIRNVPELQHINTSTHKHFILYQGDLNEGRGLEEAIMAMHHINRELVIAGDGLLRNKLEQLVKEQQLENKVRFTGYLNATELAKLTQQAWLGLNVLQNAGLSYYYSLANKFFNYIQAGVPQLCAPFPEYQNILAEYKVALPCECKTSTIIGAVQLLEHNAELYNEMKTACNRAAQVFNWQTEKEILIEHYQTLFSN